MKTLLFLMGMFSSLAAFSQFSITGNTSPVEVPMNAPAFVIDNSIVVSGTGNIDGAKVIISKNLSPGDALSYSGTLPAGVTSGYNAGTGVLSFSGNATAAEYQSLLRTVTFKTTSSATADRTISFNLGNAIAFPGTGHFYEYVSAIYTWGGARSLAASRSYFGLKGYLATITSQAENDFIKQKLGADAWIGASDDYSYINGATGKTTYTGQSTAEGHWYWVTGPAGEIGVNFSNGNVNPVTVSGKYAYWNNGEPNNSGSNEHYAEIYSSGSTGKWNDLPKSSLLGYVVEYGGMSGDPIVNLAFSRDIRMVATSVQTSELPVPYELQAPGITIDENITVNSTTTSINHARVTISTNFNPGDELSFTGDLPAEVSADYNSATGVLSFTGVASPEDWQALFRTVQFSSSSDVIGNRDVTFSLGNLVSGSNGHFYEYVSSVAPWITAKTNAAAKTYLGLHGYLATITSQAENDFIKQKLGVDAWIGASDYYAQINMAIGTKTYTDQTASEGHWYWVTGPAGEIGTNFSNGNGSPAVVSGQFMNWNNGEPNNTEPTGHYGAIYANGSNPGKWNDFASTSSLGYVVEYGGLETDPLLYLSASRTISINSILPITGLQFTATKVNNAISLDWTTVTEINTDHFDIEYSTDGRNFTKIGRLKAAINSTVSRNYHWLHTNPSANNYYRIREVDRDNRSFLSEIRHITKSGVVASIYPNPATSVINIDYPDLNKSAEATIVNSAGVSVMKIKLTQSHARIPVQHLPSGYYVVIIDGNHQTTNIGFVKK